MEGFEVEYEGVEGVSKEMAYYLTKALGIKVEKVVVTKALICKAMRKYLDEKGDLPLTWKVLLSKMVK